MADRTTSRIHADDAFDFAHSVFTAAGLDSTHAEAVSRTLVNASLQGIDSHGIVRTEAYSKNIERGGVNPRPNISITHLADSVLCVDADDGPGQKATIDAMNAAVSTAKKTGTASATIINSNHFGTAAYYTKLAAERDCVGIVMANAGPNVVPFGGIDPYFGTNPIAYSIPTDTDFNITLDIATSKVAKGYIKLAKLEGREIPDTWAVNEAGDSITDPGEYHALRPFGDHKGYGISILIDALSGVLTGMNRSPKLQSVSDDYTKPQKLGHFVVVFDIDTFTDVDAFKSEMGTMVHELKKQRTQNGFEEILLPGEIEHNEEQTRRENGIPISEDLHQTLSEVGEFYNVEFPIISN